MRLLLFLLIGLVLHAEVPEITVGVFEGLRKAEISAEKGFIIRDLVQNTELFRRWNSSKLVIELSARGFGFLEYKNLHEIEIRPFRDRPFEINGMKFRGKLVLREDRFGRMTAINHVDLESYLYGVIKSEMLLNSPREALKAQAVVARTYAIRNQNKFMNELGFGLTRDTRSQVYNGVKDEHALSIEVVNATRGRIAVVNGEPIASYYCASCGGATQDAKTWSGRPINYLKSRPCPWCASYPGFSWNMELSLAEITNRLREKGKKVLAITDIRVENDPSGRVENVHLIHQGGQETFMNANHLRTLLGPDRLRSTFFEIQSLPGMDREDPAEKAIDQILKKFMTAMDADRVVKIRGTGFGHGVGLCQWGAKGLARRGDSYEKILQYYYTGASVYRLYE